MDDSKQDSSNLVKSTKVEELKSSKTKSKNTPLSFSKKISNIIDKGGDLFFSCKNKVNAICLKCSMITQFFILLIPVSIAMIIIIFYIHLYYYSNLYVFNFSKAFKEEFFDLYITKIDDLKTELTAVVIKETKLDVENLLFFQVYFKELASTGFLDKKIISNLTKDGEIDSFSLFSKFNDYKVGDTNFTLDEDSAEIQINERQSDNLGEFVKIYYYMFPYIWHEFFLMKTNIKQSFFIVYQFDDNYTIDDGNYLFFRFPKNTDGLTINDNFIPSNYLLNPQISASNEYNDSSELSNDGSYYYGNWFMNRDYKFRKFVKKREFARKGNKELQEHNEYTRLSLAHLNYENNGDINKTFIEYSQQYLINNDENYVISIVFFIDQIDLEEGDNDYSSFIVNHLSDELTEENKKYSDNLSYVLTKSDITEYSLSKTDFQFFHLGLYNENNNFFSNGIFYDSFNLDYMYNYNDFYQSSKDGVYDLKFFTTLYLYKSLFQKVDYRKIDKEREEIFLYNFKGPKVTEICGKINFESYRSYLKNTDIDCWDKRNIIFYDEMKFKYFSMLNDSKSIDPIYTYCSCLPLYCLKNYEELDKDLNNLEIGNEINLPNKCQNKFENFRKDIDNKNSPHIDFDADIFMDSNLKPINYDYVKLIYFELNQLPGYFFLIIAQIISSGEANIHSYYKIISKIEIILVLLAVLIIASIISLIIIYRSLNKYSLIISDFKKKYELYAFHSYTEYEINSNQDNFKKFSRIKEEKKLEDQLMDSDKIGLWETDSLLTKDFYNINDNSLLDDLFLIFSKTYNINQNDIETFFSNGNHKSKNQMKLEMMKEKNELFELLCTYCLHAPSFQLNLNYDYDMYKYSEIIKRYNHYVGQLENINKEQTRLTQNILYELISTECISDYGLITNFYFNYVTNKKADSKKNSIQYTLFENIKNKSHKKEEVNFGKSHHNKKLILKRNNILIDILKDRFESDDFLNYNKLENAFNFFLINSYYKYSRQIGLENAIS